MQYLSAIDRGYKLFAGMYKVASPGSSAQIRAENVNYILDVVIPQRISHEDN
jgi:hypothetical protein